MGLSHDLTFGDLKMALGSYFKAYLSTFYGSLTYADGRKFLCVRGVFVDDASSDVKGRHFIWVQSVH